MKEENQHEFDNDEEQKRLDEEIDRLDQEYRELTGKDINQGISDEDLQSLIDINEADWKEPGGISPTRRKKLIEDVENRLSGLLEDSEPLDFLISYLKERREGLLQGASASEIDEFTLDFAEQNGIELSALITEWVGTEQLKLQQILRIEDEKTQEKMIDALAVESVTREELQEIVPVENKLSQQCEKSPQKQCYSWQSRFKHLLHSMYVFVFVEEGSKYYFQWKDLLRFILQALVYIFIMCSIAFIILAIQYFWKNLF